MQSRPLFELFEGALKCKLNREGRKYTHTEGGVEYTFQMKSRKSFAFRAQPDELNIFAGNPPAGIAKMCDAVCVIRYEDRDFIVVAEIKTGNAGDYKSQIINGRHFCEWLVRLLKEHGHYDETSEPEYLGLLIWQGDLLRKSRGSPFPLIQRYKGMNIYETAKPDVFIKNLLETHKRQ